MQQVSSTVIEMMQIDLDEREEQIRRVVFDVIKELPEPDLSDQIVATYFVAARQKTPAEVGDEIGYLMTSSVHNPPPGTLLDQCTAKLVDAVTFEGSPHTGVARVAFPLKMLLTDRGDLYSTDILHIGAGAGVFALMENMDVKLVDLAMSDKTLKLFPGPAYGAPGVRKLAGFDPGEVAFGTILKPSSGITPEEEETIVAEAATNPLFLFVKEDEDYMPNLPYSPLDKRIRLALDAIERMSDQREGKGLIFAPHITAPPDRFIDNVKCAVDAGVNAVMFSEYYVGGAVRMVRDMTKHLDNPPAIYAHNGGISCRTRHVYRELLDMLARLDGADFRQTAPVSLSGSLLRPAGLEWERCERVLSQPLAGHAPVMMARAGGLDQGNIIPNLMDAKRRGGVGNYLFLAGSAINCIKNGSGEYDPAIGAEAMRQASEMFDQGMFGEDEPPDVRTLKDQADRQGHKALSAALTQRYGL